MADINVERKGPSIWPWIIGLIILALLIWALAELLGDDADEVAIDEPLVEEVEPAPAVTPAPLAAGATCVGDVMMDPATWIGQTVDDCQMRVVEVPTDRGFWVEENGQRMFVILNDAGDEQPVDINTGQTVRLSEAMVYDNIDNVPGNIDPETRNLVQGQPVFLAVDQDDVEILQGAGM